MNQIARQYGAMPDGVLVLAPERAWSGGPGAFTSYLDADTTDIFDRPPEQ